MKHPLKVLITGSNRGIGFELGKAFLRLNPNASIYATSIEKLEIASQQWKAFDQDNRVKCMYLDVTSKQNILEVAQNIKRQNVKIDILINNAGLGKASELHKTIPDPQFARQCFSINVLGAMNLTENLLPHLSDTAKVVNLSSFYGALRYHPESTQRKFSDPSITKQDIIDAIDQYIKEAQNKKMVSFSPNVYATSKMLMGAWSRFIVQKQWLKGEQKSICVTPGLCLTAINDQVPQEMKEKAFTAENGALKIHQTIFFPDLDPNVFYHRARKSTFELCGKGLPWE